MEKQITAGCCCNTVQGTMILYRALQWLIESQHISEWVKVNNALTVVFLGIIRFTQTVKLYERNDEELGALNNQLRTIVMPLMAAPAPPEPPVSDNPISPAPASPAAAAAMSPMVAAVGSPPSVSQATSWCGMKSEKKF